MDEDTSVKTVPDFPFSLTVGFNSGDVMETIVVRGTAKLNWEVTDYRLSIYYLEDGAKREAASFNEWVYVLSGDINLKVSK
jgi:hypothetical protein